MYKYPDDDEELTKSQIFFSPYIFKFVADGDKYRLHIAGRHAYTSDLHEFIFLPDQEELNDSHLMPFYITELVEDEDEDAETIYKMVSSPMTRMFEQKDIEYNYQIANNFINKMLEYADYYVK